jgi:iron(III) transport system substrate-binding protein
MRALSLALAVCVAGCRIETATPGGAAAQAEVGQPSGEVWIYTSMYRHVVDALEPVLKEALPNVTVRWFQAGSEKVLSRLEAELASGGTQADLLAVSDPFLYARFKAEGRWLRYASPNAQRTPRALVDLDGDYQAMRLSTMVLVHARGTPAPEGFAALTQPAFKGEVALGDPLTSGTAFTWSVFLEAPGYFAALRANGARLAGGNAAVLQKVEGGEAKVGVLLLENALVARGKGSPIEVVWPSDKAVLIPGELGILRSSRNPVAAKAVVDVLLGPRAQQALVGLGDMHSVDPRLPGPRGEPGLEVLLERTRPWSPALLEHGVREGGQLKAEIARTFSQ